LTQISSLVFKNSTHSHGLWKQGLPQQSGKD
jgi:hypothetical protein